MNFTTKIPIHKYQNTISYESKILLLGSCFAENISNKFQYFKFQNTTNPFGIIFNPVSLEKLIRRAVENNYFNENDVFYHNDLWHCFEVHSELSNPDKNSFLNSLNELIDATQMQLNNATHTIITLGTSWVYRSIETNEIVANCHKVPQKQFTKELLSIAQIEESLHNIVSLFYSVNPNCNLIFTISPVRHIKDGFIENQQSKAHLVSALHAILSRNVAKTTYFPAYEIMLDELRDYRFYANDLLHPSDLALQYIWEIFVNTSFSTSSIELMAAVEAVQKNKSHRSFHPNSEKHQQFLVKTVNKIKALQQLIPHLNFDSED